MTNLKNLYKPFEDKVNEFGFEYNRLMIYTKLNEELFTDLLALETILIF